MAISATFKRSIETKWAFAYRLLIGLLLVGVSNFWGFSSPNGFVKCASIIEVNDLPLLQGNEFRYFVDPRQILAPLPSGETEFDEAWIIDPDLRLKRVFEGGVGNCAFRSKALARKLQGMGVPYNIVWVMHAAKARGGEGHTLVECPIQVNEFQGAGLIDMLEGGVPLSNLRPLQVEDLLSHSEISEFRMQTFSPLYDSLSSYYGPYLTDAAIGVTTSGDMNKYSDFIARVYTPLGYYRLEKGVYIVGAMVLGYYPPVYMSSTEIARFDAWFHFEIVLARAMIWAIRLLIAMGIIDIVRLLNAQIRRVRSSKYVVH